MWIILYASCPIASNPFYSENACLHKIWCFFYYFLNYLFLSILCILSFQISLRTSGFLNFLCHFILCSEKISQLDLPTTCSLPCSMHSTVHLLIFSFYFNTFLCLRFLVESLYLNAYFSLIFLYLMCSFDGLVPRTCVGWVYWFCFMSWIFLNVGWILFWNWLSFLWLSICQMRVGIYCLLSQR